ncbi:hypothetical protein MBLNU230_g7832t1 [Neophaeotheca triangularis]
MNNEEFRKSLLAGNNARKPEDAAVSSTPKSSALGGKRSNFGGMTPRTVRGSTTGGVDFARQAREQRASSLVPTQVGKKKFKSTAAPKGSKLGLGYTDRAKARQEAEKDDDKEERIKALEEQMKLGQIEPELFASLRDEITGGDVGSTHLVKGLDRQLLARVRRGEDVMGGGGQRKKEDVEEENAEPGVDDEEELDKMAEKEVKAVERERLEKKGAKPTTSMPPPPVAGVKRSRADILKDFKAQRAAAAEAKAAPVLDKSKWRRIDEGKKEKTRTEIDRKGREVLIVIDKDGKEKRMIKKPGQTTIPELDPKKPVLGADVKIPELSKPNPVEEEEDGGSDIFEGVGDYDPFEGIGDSDDSSDDEGEKSGSKRDGNDDSAATEEGATAATDATPSKHAVPRNYFGTTTATKEDVDPFAGQADITNILKKAASMRPLNTEDAEEDEDDDETSEAREIRLAREKRHKEMLSNQDRDYEDMDMGFGGGRFDDDEDDPNIKLSKWTGGKGGDDEGDEDGDQGKKGDGKKKRKGKKRKGDGNNVDDVMRVIDGRNKG